MFEESPDYKLIESKVRTKNAKQKRKKEKQTFQQTTQIVVIGYLRKQSEVTGNIPALREIFGFTEHSENTGNMLISLLILCHNRT